MGMTSGMYSANRKDYSTPQDFFDRLDEEFSFELDACAEEWCAKCEHYYSPEQDALKQDWTGNTFCNPPYGTGIVHWVHKAYMEATKGSLVVCLLPARTDTVWFHTWCLKANEIRLVKGRLRFEPGNTSAPFPSAVVIYRPQLLLPGVHPILTSMDAREEKK